MGISWGSIINYPEWFTFFFNNRNPVNFPWPHRQVALPRSVSPQGDFAATVDVGAVAIRVVAFCGFFGLNILNPRMREWP
jgi:hypothetical protein